MIKGETKKESEVGCWCDSQQLRAPAALKQMHPERGETLDNRKKEKK